MAPADNLAQTWIAVSVCVLVAIVWKRLDAAPSLYTCLKVVSVKIFEKPPLQSTFLGETYRSAGATDTNSLSLLAF
jgi:hypothetical protein